MKRIKLFVVVFAFLIGLNWLFACSNEKLGGLSLNNSDTVINGTIFDTKNLDIIPNDIIAKSDYAVKVIGATTPLSDSDYDRWFQNAESDPLGKLAVCIKLELEDKVLKDANATITLLTAKDSKTDKLSDVKDGDNYIYLILNTYHDWVEIVIDYKDGKTSKDINYNINLVDVEKPGEVDKNM
ncbi:MAG: hypothetical protein IJA61_04230 [Clostridia bacterium]|nr:hypothetical protein [Clostridia bacterium]